MDGELWINRISLPQITMEPKKEPFNGGQQSMTDLVDLVAGSMLVWQRVCDGGMELRKEAFVFCGSSSSSCLRHEAIFGAHSRLTMTLARKSRPP